MRIVVCGNYGVANTGDEAILEGLCLLLRRAFPEAAIEVQGRGRFFPVGIRSFFKSLIIWRLFLVPYRIVRSCDLFVLGGGGLFTDEEGPFVSTFWALHGLVASLLNKKVVCIGIGVGKVYFWNKWLLKLLFTRCQKVIVRDHNSLKRLTQWNIKAFEASDAALSIPFAINASKKIEKNAEKYVVISVREWKNFNEKLYTIFAQLCNSLIDKYGLYIRLIPFQDGPKNDASILNKIFDQITEKNQAKVENYYTNIHDLVKVLAGAQFVFAMRLHAGILSLLAQTPFLSLSYMDKVADFWADFEVIPKISLEAVTASILEQAFEKSKKELTPEILHSIQIKLTKKNEGIIEFLRAAM